PARAIWGFERSIPRDKDSVAEDGVWGEPVSIDRQPVDTQAAVDNAVVDKQAKGNNIVLYRPTGCLVDVSGFRCQRTSPMSERSRPSQFAGSGVSGTNRLSNKEWLRSDRRARLRALRERADSGFSEDRPLPGTLYCHTV